MVSGRHRDSQRVGIGKQNAHILQYRQYANPQHGQLIGGHCRRTWFLKQFYRQGHIEYENRCRVDALEELEFETQSPYYLELLREAKIANKVVVDSQVRIDVRDLPLVADLSSQCRLDVVESVLRQNQKRLSQGLGAEQLRAWIRKHEARLAQAAVARAKAEALAHAQAQAASQRRLQQQLVKARAHVATLRMQAATYRDRNLSMTAELRTTLDALHVSEDQFRSAVLALRAYNTADGASYTTGRSSEVPLQDLQATLDDSEAAVRLSEAALLASQSTARALEASLRRSRAAFQDSQAALNAPDASLATSLSALRASEAAHAEDRENYSRQYAAQEAQYRTSNGSLAFADMKHRVDPEAHDSRFTEVELDNQLLALQVAEQQSALEGLQRKLDNLKYRHAEALRQREDVEIA